MAKWSLKVADHYGMTLSEDVRNWLDEEIWQQTDEERYRALSPDEWLDPPAAVVWGGFMLPDTLPVVGTAFGDWLCLRCDRENQIREVVHWSHAGGDWLPLGRNLAEALLFETADVYRAPHDGSRMNEPSAGPRVAAEWARNQLPGGSKIERFWESGTVQQDVCRQANLGPIAWRHHCTLEALDNRLRREVNAQLAGQLRVPWEPDAVSWLFDSRQTPSAFRPKFERILDQSFDEAASQDWESAEAWSLEVLQERPDLAWAADIAGWAAERRGDHGVAIQRYMQGLHASLFSDHCVSFRTHWFPEGLGKFTAARLLQLHDHLDDAIREDEYLQIFWENDPESLRARVRDYWMEQGQRLESDQRYDAAYEAYYRAGWDLGLQYASSYVEILEHLARVAEKGNARTLAKLAMLHADRVVGR